MAVSEKELKAAHLRYDETIKLKSDKLSDLDKWYRSELVTLVNSRKDKTGSAYLTTQDLVKLMKWKLTRGKFRPRLEQLAQSNASEEVEAQTKKAFKIVSSTDSIDAAKEALTVLNTLKGIGPATSSAILAVFKPKSLPFMSDEALEFGAGLNGKPKYSVTEWKWFTEKMQLRAKRESWKGGVRELEEAAWALAVLRRKGVWTQETITDEKVVAKIESTPKSKRSSNDAEQSQTTPLKRARKGKK